MPLPGRSMMDCTAVEPVHHNDSPAVLNRNSFDPRQTEFVHLHGQLEQIIQALTLSLGFGDIVAPDISAEKGQFATDDMTATATATATAPLTSRAAAPTRHMCQDIPPSPSPNFPSNPLQRRCFR